MELRLAGRLDALWADHVESAISESVREGHHHITLNMAEVDFVSSAGIRVLLKFHKQLVGIDGRLLVTKPSEFVAEVFDTMGLSLLVSAEEPPKTEPPAADTGQLARTLETETAEYEIRRPSPGEAPRCRVLGNPSATATAAYRENDCRPVDFPQGVFAVGIGAPGRDFADCHDRFGDFVAVDGAVAFLPTGHGNVPDYLTARGNFVPSLQVLHCLICEGELDTTVSFQARSGCSVPMSELVEQCLAAAESETVALVMAAEIDGLVGASLQKSPVAAAAAGDPTPFDFPQIRDWIKFTSQRVFTSEVALVAGIAARGHNPAMAESLRPLATETSLQGHFHAAAFSYHPLRKTEIAVSQTVRDLFERERLRGLLHLLNDTRPINGVGQSEFVRGTCWVAKIESIED